MKTKSIVKGTPREVSQFAIIAAAVTIAALAVAAVVWFGWALGAVWGL